MRRHEKLYISAQIRAIKAASPHHLLGLAEATAAARLVVVGRVRCDMSGGMSTPAGTLTVSNQKKLGNRAAGDSHLPP